MKLTSNLKRKVRKLIDEQQFEIWFQPIFNVKENSIVGYEALMRLTNKDFFTTPNDVFKTANKVGLLSELEYLCRHKAIIGFSHRHLKGLLFLNVSPFALCQPDHCQGKTVKMLESVGLSPDQVVIEVTEQFASDDQPLLKHNLNYYRSLGFKIAIDDLGTGHSGLMQWAEILPDIVKIDRYFISQCHTNIVKRELLRTIFELGEATGVKIIAEGIETLEEFQQLSVLGMELGQGYLLAYPTYQPLNKLPAVMNLTAKTQYCSLSA